MGIAACEVKDSARKRGADLTGWRQPEISFGHDQGAGGIAAMDIARYLDDLGWKISPGEFTENDEEVLNRKDPLQFKRYKYANQIDTVMDRCMQLCPVGKGGYK